MFAMVSIHYLLDLRERKSKLMIKNIVRIAKSLKQMLICYCNLQLRNASGICYSWAYESFSACCGGIGSSLPGLWEISVSFSRALGVHMKVKSNSFHTWYCINCHTNKKNNAFTIYLQKKAAGALFLGVAEFEMMSSRHEANHAGSIASVLAKIIEPFTNRYCYDAGRDINMAWLGKKNNLSVH